MTSNVVPLHKQSLEEAFPKATPGAEPLGDKVLVQLRNAKRKTASGIILGGETQDQEKWITTIGKVIALGPLAYRNREDPSKPWPEGAWVKIGDYVRVPKWGGDRWEVKVDPKDVAPDAETARYVLYRDREMIARVTGDPLAFTDYV